MPALGALKMRQKTWGLSLVLAIGIAKFAKASAFFDRTQPKIDQSPEGKSLRSVAVDYINLAIVMRRDNSLR